MAAACVATWSFGVEAVERASLDLKDEGHCVDALEKAVNGNISTLDFRL